MADTNTKEDTNTEDLLSEEERTALTEKLAKDTVARKAVQDQKNAEAFDTLNPLLYSDEFKAVRKSLTDYVSENPDAVYTSHVQALLTILTNLDSVAARKT